MESFDEHAQPVFNSIKNFKPDFEGPYRIIADWATAMQKSAGIEAPLIELMNCFQVQIAHLVRWESVSNTSRQILKIDPGADKIFTRKLEKSFAEFLLGSHINSASPGSLWLLSEVRNEAAFQDDPSLQQWLGVRKIKDLVIIALGHGGHTSDFLELHFDHSLSDSDIEKLKGLAPALAYSWTGRRVGLVAYLFSIARENRKLLNGEWSKISILDPSNPANLSRSEFRVCMLLGLGKTPQGIGQELGLADSTVRSHLHNIYSKTGTSGQVELIYRLHGTSTKTPGDDQMSA